MLEANNATNSTSENIQAFGQEALNISRSKLYLAAAGLAIASSVVDLKEHSSPVYLALDIAAAVAWATCSIYTFRQDNSANTHEA